MIKLVKSIKQNKQERNSMGNVHTYRKLRADTSTMPGPVYPVVPESTHHVADPPPPHPPRIGDPYLSRGDQITIVIRA